MRQPSGLLLPPSLAARGECLRPRRLPPYKHVAPGIGPEAKTPGTQSMSASLPACWLSLPSALLTLLSLRLEPGQCRPCCLFFSERCWSATINVHFLPHSSPMPSVRAAGRSPHGGKEGRRDFAADLARQEGEDGSSAKRRCHREVWLPRKACMPEMRIRLSVHIWAEPAGWKSEHGGLLHECCWDTAAGCERRKKALARGCLLPPEGTHAVQANASQWIQERKMAARVAAARRLRLVLSIHSLRSRAQCHCTKLAGCSGPGQKRTTPDDPRCESCAGRKDGRAQ